MGKWYEVTWSWCSRHYYDEVEHWEVVEGVFIPEGGSIAKYILKELKRHVAEGTVYECEERGFQGYGVSCGLSNLALILPNGLKLSGFKPKSIAHLL